MSKYENLIEWTPEDIDQLRASAIADLVDAKAQPDDAIGEMPIQDIRTLLELVIELIHYIDVLKENCINYRKGIEVENND